MVLTSWHGPAVGASMGRNRNLLSLGNVAGEQTLVRTGISLTSSDDDRPEVPFEDDFNSETAARFGDLSAMPVASGDSGLLTGDDLAVRWLAVDCAAPSRLAADILALILAARPPRPPGGSGDPDSRTRKLSPEDDVGALSNRRVTAVTGPPATFLCRCPAEIAHADIS